MAHELARRGLALPRAYGARLARLVRSSAPTRASSTAWAPRALRDRPLSAKFVRGFRAAAGPARHVHDDGLDHTRQTVPITFVQRKDGERRTVDAVVGDNLLVVAHKHGIALEGACECSIACSTCHVYVEEDVFDALEDAGLEACEDEEDMLDLAFGLEPTSRLGCCVKVQADHAGMEVTLPAASRNFYVDGHVPEPH
jgi:ferredoxin